MTANDFEATVRQFASDRAMCDLAARSPYCKFDRVGVASNYGLLRPNAEALV